MMTEIALNVLDVANNSVRAGATLITISVKADTQADTRYLRVSRITAAA